MTWRYLKKARIECNLRSDFYTYKLSLSEDGVEVLGVTDDRAVAVAYFFWRPILLASATAAPAKRLNSWAWKGKPPEKGPDGATRS